MTVDKQGFAHYQAKDIDLPVGKNIGLDISLELGAATAQVEVTGTPEVDDTKTDVSQVVDSQQILDLPINGRRVDSFVLLTPALPTMVTSACSPSAAWQTAIPSCSTATTPPISSTSRTTAAPALRRRFQDAVQEFQVVSANYSAEYGRAMGGVVNTVTRSGTNDLHGTAYWFYPQSGHDGPRPIRPLINPNQWRLQSGASVGGPIIKDKLFFFINGDFTRHNFPLVDTYTGTSINSTATTPVFNPDRPGNPNGCTRHRHSAQCAAINALLPRFFGLIPRTVDQDLAFGRIDYHSFGPQHLQLQLQLHAFQVYPMVSSRRSSSSTTGAGVNGNGNDYGRVRNGKVTWTSILSSNIVNQFRYGWNTDWRATNSTWR